MNRKYQTPKRSATLKISQSAARCRSTIPMNGINSITRPHEVRCSLAHYFAGTVRVFVNIYVVFLIAPPSEEKVCAFIHVVSALPLFAFPVLSSSATCVFELDKRGCVCVCMLEGGANLQRYIYMHMWWRATRRRQV